LLDRSEQHLSARGGRGSGGRISFSATIGEDSVHFTVGLSFDEVLAAVPMGFACAETHEDFEATVFQISLEGNEGATSFFLDLAEESDDLVAVKEKFAGPFGFQVGTIAVAVGGDVEGVEPGFSVLDFAVGVCEITPACSQGFDFGTREDDSSFDRFGDGEVVTGFPVLDFDRFQGAGPRRLGRR
jgi:hypothetical protein